MAEVGRHLDGAERELAVVDREGALHDAVAAVVDHVDLDRVGADLVDEGLVRKLRDQAGLRTDDAHVLGHHVRAVETHDRLVHVIALAVEEDALLEGRHAGEHEGHADGRIVVDAGERGRVDGLALAGSARASRQGQDADDESDLQVVQVQVYPLCCVPQAYPMRQRTIPQNGYFVNG